ncbi:MAG: hypothetical protein AAGH15_04330 [Myxococcota bacterium]
MVSAATEDLGTRVARLATEVGTSRGYARPEHVAAFNALAREATRGRPELRPAFPAPIEPPTVQVPRRALLARLHQLSAVRRSTGRRHALVVAAGSLRQVLAPVADASEVHVTLLNSLGSLRDAVGAELPESAARLPVPITPQAPYAQLGTSSDGMAGVRAALHRLQRLLIEADHRLVVCPTGVAGAREWRFLLTHDGETPLDDVTLVQVAHEALGGATRFDHHVPLGPLAPGDHVEVFVGDEDGAELRTDLTLHVRRGATTVPLRYEFPKLYRKRTFPWVEGLGRRGMEGRAIDVLAAFGPS